MVENSMKKILFVTNMEQTAALLQDALEKVREQYPESLKGQVCYLQSDASWEMAWEKTFTDFDVIIFPWMGTGLNTKFLSESSAFLQNLKYKSLSNIMFMAVCKTGVIYGYGSARIRLELRKSQNRLLICPGKVFIILLQTKFIQILKNIKKSSFKQSSQR